MTFTGTQIKTRLTLLIWLIALPLPLAQAQDGAASSSPAGLSMLVLFLGIAGIIGVFVIRWSQSTGDDDEPA